MSKPLILFFSPVRHALTAYKALSSCARTELVTSTSRQDFFKDIEGKYRDAVAIYRTSASGVVAGPFDEEFISKLPKSINAICHNGAGYDQIDVDACLRHKITLTYALDPVTGATADLTMFLLLGAIRKLNPGLLALRKDLFKTGIDFEHDPKGKTLGVLGMGRIGRAVVQRALPFGMNIIYHNRTVLSEDLAAGFPWVSFQQLLEESDVISIHLPLSQSTRQLIGAAEIASMKKGVVIVNTARGAILDEAALAEALESGHVGSVGLDVYEKEPVVHPLLIRNDRAVLLPHLGTHTMETLAAMEALAMENARRAVCGEKLFTVVPEHLHM